MNGAMKTTLSHVNTQGPRIKEPSQKYWAKCYKYTLM